MRGHPWLHNKFKVMATVDSATSPSSAKKSWVYPAPFFPDAVVIPEGGLSWLWLCPQQLDHCAAHAEGEGRRKGERERGRETGWNKGTF